MRFSLRIELLMRPLALLFTATPSRSYVEVTDDSVRFRFGLFDEVVPRAEVAHVEPYEPRWYQGWGWRWLPYHVMLFGSHRGVVSFVLTRSRRVRVLPFLPRLWPANRISVAVKEPERLIESVST